MKTTKLKLGDVLQLGNEITGDETRVFKGILEEKLPFKTKYWLTKLGDQIQRESKMFNTLRDGIIKEFGEADEAGVYSISPTVKDKKEDVPNPNMDKFINKIDEALDVEVELKHAKFELKEFENLESTNVYAILYTLIEE